jgi:hypothetical protein
MDEVSDEPDSEVPVGGLALPGGSSVGWASPAGTWLAPVHGPDPEGTFGVSRTAELLEILAESWQADARMWVQRLQLVSLLRLSVQPAPWQCRTPDRDESLISEIALTLHLSETAAQRVWAEAATLDQTPLLADAALAGRVNVPQARVLLELLEPVAETNPAAVEQVLVALLTDRPAVGDPIDLPPPRLREWTRRRIATLDPEGVAARRKRRTRAETGMRTRLLEDGLAQLVLTGPVDRVLGLARALDPLADRLVPPGTLDPTQDWMGNPADCELTHGQRLLAAVEQIVAQAGAAHRLAPVPVELQLLLPALAPDGYRADALDRPLVQPEPITLVLDPDGLDQLLAAQARAERLRTQRREPPDSTGSHDGGPDGSGPDGSGPGGSGPGGSGPGGSGPPRSPRPPDDLRTSGPPELSGREHSDRWTPELDPATPTVPPRPIELLGYGPLDPAHAAEILFRPEPSAGSGGPRLPEIRIRRLLVDRRAGIAAVDAVPVLLDQAHTAPPPPPPAATTAYRFTTAQQRVLRTRDRHCTFPGCGRTALRADLDHLLSYPAGPTSVGNADPKCRRHHRTKHHGWDVERHHDGTVLWTAPSGRQYTHQPD